MPDNTTTWYTTNNSTLEITGVQLEVGSVATDFEHRSFAEELALCQRYCYAVPVGTTGANYHAVLNGFYASSTLFIGLLNLPTAMRGSPSLATSGSFQTAGTSSFSVSSLTINDVAFDNVHSIQFRCAVSGATAGQGANFRNDASNTAKFILSAEL